VAGRDETWQHPDLMPQAADLADPLAYLSRLDQPPAEDPFDAEWRRLLAGEGPGESPDEGPASPSSGQ